MSDVEDVSWATIATELRGAARVLGAISPQCLPWEDKPCGRGSVEHAAMYIGVLRAIIQMHIDHLPTLELVQVASEAFDGELGDLRAQHKCEAKGCLR